MSLSTPDPITDPGLSRCVHCGLCLEACPTYLQTRLETESPRGRISLVKAVQDKRLPLGGGVAAHLESCVQCRACEAVCPSGVPFGRIMESARVSIESQARRSFLRRLGRRFVFRMLFVQPGLLRTLVLLLRIYQRTGLQWAVREFRLLKPFKGLRSMEQQVPALRPSFKVPRSRVFKAEGKAGRRVAMLSGCVMPLIYGPVNEATVRVLTRNGCEVVVPRGQGCCGALHLHNGERAAAQALARKNIDSFLSAGTEAVVVNAAGCGAAMKEYGELLQEDPLYRDKARQLSGMVQDISQYLASLPLQPPGSPIRERVAYQDSCHLAHVQRIKDAPRKVLRSIPALEFVEMEGSDTCCGAGGLYSVTQRELSERILEAKIRSVRQSGAAVLATANPGCMLQLEAGVRRAKLDIRVVHVVELLDEAYRGSRQIGA